MQNAIANPSNAGGTHAGTSPAVAALDASLHTRRAGRRGSSSVRGVFAERRDHTSAEMAQTARPLVFFSFDEADRWAVWRLRNLAFDRGYSALDFDVADLYLRWSAATQTERRRAITTATLSCTITVVLVGENSHTSEWIADEVATSIESGMAVIAMRLPCTNGPVPVCLASRGIVVHDWDEATLQQLTARASSR